MIEGKQWWDYGARCKAGARGDRRCRVLELCVEVFDACGPVRCKQGLKPTVPPANVSDSDQTTEEPTPVLPHSPNGGDPDDVQAAESLTWVTARPPVA